MLLLRRSGLRCIVAGTIRMGIPILPHLPQATTTGRIKRNVIRMNSSYRLQGYFGAGLLLEDGIESLVGLTVLISYLPIFTYSAGATLSSRHPVISSTTTSPVRVDTHR